MFNENNFSTNASFGNVANFNPSNIQNTDEVIQVVLCFDVSGSMTPFISDLNDARRSTIHAWQQSHHSGKILYSEYVFSDHVTLVQAYQPIANVIAQDSNSESTTALIECCYKAAKAAYEYAEQLGNTAIDSKIICCVFTDGCDNASKGVSTTDVRNLMNQIYDNGRDEFAMMNYEFIVFGLGDEASYFQSVSKEMGWKVATQDPSDNRPIGTVLREFVSVVSKSVSSGNTQALNNIVI